MYAPPGVRFGCNWALGGFLLGKCIAFLIIVPVQNKKVLCGDGLRYKRLLGGNVEEGIKSLRFWKRVGKTNETVLHT